MGENEGERIAGKEHKKKNRSKSRKAVRRNKCGQSNGTEQEMN